MRFSPGCGCCATTPTNCSECIALFPSSVNVQVDSVSGCGGVFSAGQSWSLSLAVTESDRKVYRATPGTCANYVEVYLICQSGTPSRYVCIVAFVGNAYPTIPANTEMSGGGTAQYDCVDPVDATETLTDLGAAGCCAFGDSITVSVTE